MGPVLPALVGLLAQLAWPGPLQEVIPLTGPWRFRAGDDLSYAYRWYDDSRWDTVSVPAAWSVGGQPYQGYGWYRISISIGHDQQKPLAVRFWSVATAFEVYADGYLIGSIGGFPPRYRARTVVPAVFTLPAQFLEAGTHVIAVRIYSEENLGGIVGAVELGTDEALRGDEQRGDLYRLATAALLLGIGATQLIFWARRTHAAEHLLIFGFALFLSLFFVTAMHSVRLALEPTIYWVRVYLALSCAGAASLMFALRRLFQIESDRVVATLGVFFAVAVVPSLLLPEFGQLKFFSNYVLNYAFLIASGVVLWTAVRALRTGARHARILLWGTGFLSLAIAHDILVDFGLLTVRPTSMWMSMLGAIAFTAALAMTTAESFADSETAALYDRLTGLYRREVVLDALQREIRRASRTRQSLAVIMLDVDRFKQINDTLGHQVGDKVLAEIGRRLMVAGRAVDWLGRYGGEEFIAVLAATGREGGFQAAERLRSAVSALPIPTGRSTRTVTLSAGVAAYEGGEEWPTPEEMVGRADQALYRAKNAGRNCVSD